MMGVHSWKDDVMNLCSMYVSTSVLQQILRLLKDNSPKIKKLNLSGAQLLMYDFINQLVAALEKNTCLQELKLDFLQIQDLSAEKLATLLGLNTGLTHLSLLGNPFDLAQGDLFESMLQKNTTIQELRIICTNERYERFKNRLYINKCILPNPYWKPSVHDDFLLLSKSMIPIHNMIIITLVCNSFSPVSIPYMLWLEIFSYWKWHNLLLM